MLALIDADLVAYRAAASAEEEEVSVALYRTDKTIQDILTDVGTYDFRAYLTGSNNFRKALTPDYKANRKDKPLPQHLAACRQFLVTEYKAEVCDGYEADDALGVNQRTEGTIICSLDKDLLQVPGHHYNWVKKFFDDVSEDEGLLSFYTSTLVGDRSDNITGVVGIGPVKAGNALRGHLPEDWYQICREMYNDDERYHLNCKLLWIWRTMNGTWQPPTDVHHCGQDAKPFPPDVLGTCDCIFGADIDHHTGGCTRGKGSLSGITCE